MSSELVRGTFCWSIKNSGSLTLRHRAVVLDVDGDDVLIANFTTQPRKNFIVLFRTHPNSELGQHLGLRFNTYVTVEKIRTSHLYGPFERLPVNLLSQIEKATKKHLKRVALI